MCGENGAIFAAGSLSTRAINRFLADLRLETLWVSKFSALRKTADSSNRRFEVQRRPTGNRLRFQANLRGMY
jgi:hypothetical protein